METYTLTQNDLTALLTAAAEAGAAKIAALLSPQDEYISQNEAWRIYGRTSVEQWVAEGSIRPQLMGNAANSRKAYKRSELNMLATARKASELVVRKNKSHRPQA